MKKQHHNARPKLAKDRVTLDRAFSKAGLFSRTEALLGGARMAQFAMCAATDRRRRKRRDVCATQFDL
ncbi:MAG: hypothetical protein L0387_17235 [Acidobacteria bacterium]|nr:hypothetical protein [Acidobacteriota bacterium]MCI0623375.1 hypothetical protein [Acidobacteriota bacterium]MCI0721598.1 hypothetical protein [Acidobacteriota bacterium]